MTRHSFAPIIAAALAVLAAPAIAQVADPKSLCEQQTTAIAREDSKLAIQLAQNGASVPLTADYKKFLTKAVEEIKGIYGPPNAIQLSGSVGEMGEVSGYFILSYSLNGNPLYFVCSVAQTKAGPWMVTHTTYNSHLGPLLQTAFKR